MASIRKKGDKWQASVCVGGKREAKSFPTKTLAQKWARDREVELSTPKIESAKSLTVGDLLARYSRDVSERKRGRKWEWVRLAAFGRSSLAGVRLRDLTPFDIASWRDERSRAVAAGSVRREMTLLSSVFTVAVREWGVLAENPVRMVRRPAAPPHRDKLFSQDEIEAICNALGYSGGKAESASQQVAVAFLVALETAMRQGEILGLTQKSVDYANRVATLKQTKNGKPRKVPLTTKAAELLKEQGAWTISPDTCSTLFRKARRQAGVDDATFHDARHTAITRLAKILQPLDLARMTGHSDLKQLMTYYNESAAEIATRLN